MNAVHDFLAQSAVWGVLLTLSVFSIGTFLNRKTGWVLLNPLLLGALSIIGFLLAFNIPYAEFKVSSAPISYMLTPAMVSLAIPLYEKWDLLMKNLTAILVGILAGIITSLTSVLTMALVLRMEFSHAVTLMPKTVTTPMAMDIAKELGGISALAGAVVVLTGIIGNISAEDVCRIFRVTEPVAKGIAIGTSSHAIGTAKALQMGEIEGAMSGLAVGIAAIMTGILTPLAAAFLRL